jgi:hypothetical protein
VEQFDVVHKERGEEQRGHVEKRAELGGGEAALAERDAERGGVGTRRDSERVSMHGLTRAFVGRHQNSERRHALEQRAAERIGAQRASVAKFHTRGANANALHIVNGVVGVVVVEQCGAQLLDQCQSLLGVAHQLVCGRLVAQTQRVQRANQLARGNDESG